MDGSYICTKDKRKGSWGGGLPHLFQSPSFHYLKKKKSQITSLIRILSISCAVRKSSAKKTKINTKEK